ncbi:MAG TPA: DNA polymerase III subunit beta [Chromatiaceae bacterium]|jgi:DNA polymerase-3 subunit beta|nr:DNA polymerase III subunit beta [Chromatiaceae bacterium]HIB85010.1 DNA polymerase III subunit beta [Chromatiaceae bacterium]
MKFSCSKETLLKPLQAVIGVVERRQTLPILSNILLVADDKGLSLTATDLEVQLTATADIAVKQAGRAAVPGRKLLDICRSLPDGTELQISIAKERATVKAGRSRFALALLSPGDFPLVEDPKDTANLTMPEGKLKALIEQTQFAMAQQDVRYYLNGLMLEFSKQGLRSVATDGHRLALSDVEIEFDIAETQQIIVPRKGVLELSRLLEAGDGEAQIRLAANHIQVVLPELTFISKLVDGRFPDYQRVIPKGPSQELSADRDILRAALSRTAILSNEKYRGVRLHLSENTLRIVATNPEQEEAEEDVEVSYRGGNMEIGFNVRYLIDALNAIEGGDIQIQLSDANSSCLIIDKASTQSQYVVMPMRL